MYGLRMWCLSMSAANAAHLGTAGSGGASTGCATGGASFPLSAGTAWPVSGLSPKFSSKLPSLLDVSVEELELVDPLVAEDESVDMAELPDIDHASDDESGTSAVDVRVAAVAVRRSQCWAHIRMASWIISSSGIVVVRMAISSAAVWEFSN